MREDEAGRTGDPRQSLPILQRMRRVGARASAVALLAAGVAESLAARRNRRPTDKGDGGDAGKERGNERGNNRNRESKDEQDGGGKNRERDRDADQPAKEGSHARHGDGQGGRERAARAESEDGGRHRRRDSEGEDPDSRSADLKQKQTTNKDDEPNADTSGDGGNRPGNAGSDLFDSPLATKARRRANDFEGRDREEEDDGIVIDVDPEGESTYETGSISFSTGPDGIEIVTRNITYTAAPTPTPTPFPTLELPERESFVFGSAAPTEPATSGPSDSGDGAPTEPEPEPEPDAGDGAPTDGGDTSGGDNSGDFVS